MNKEQILEMLKLLKDKLPSNGFINDDSRNSQLYNHLAKRIVETNDGLRRLEDLSEVESESLVNLGQELDDLVDEIEIQKSELNSQIKSKLLYDSDAYRESVIASVLRKKLARETNEEEKKVLQEKLDEAEKAYNDNVAWAKETEESAFKIRDEVIKLEEKQSELEDRIDTERKVQFERFNQDYEKKLDARRKQTDMLRGQLGFLNVGGMLDSLISDYENGLTNEAEVNYRMHLLQYQLNDPNVRNMMRIISDEQRSLTNDQIESLSEEAEALRNKVADATNYILNDEEYNARHEEVNSELNDSIRKAKLARRRYEDTLDKMNELRSNDNLSPEAQTVINKELKRLEALSKKQYAKMANAEVIVADKEIELRDLESSYGKVNTKELEDDKQHLIDLDNKVKEMRFFSVLDPLSIDERVNSIIDATKGEEEYLSDFIKPDKEETAQEGKEVEPTKNEEEPLIEKPTLDEEDVNELEPVFPRIKEEDLNIDLPPVVEPNKIKNVSDPNPSLKSKIKKMWEKAKVWILTLVAVAGIGTGGVALKNHLDNVKNENEIQDVLNDQLTVATLQELKDIIIKCKAVNGSLYTPDSYNRMMNRVNFVETVISNDALTESSAKEYVKDLKDAYNKLVLLNKVEQDKEDNKNNQQNNNNMNNGGNTGNNGNSSDNNGGNNNGSGDNSDEDIYLEDGEKIVLMPGDSVDTPYGSVDYDGVQRDNEGKELSIADVEMQEDGSVFVDNDDLVKEDDVSQNDSVEDQIEWDFESLDDVDWTSVLEDSSRSL